MRKILLLAIVLLFGVALLWFGTDGFRAYTAEGARRLDVERNPRQVLDVRMTDQTGQSFSMADLKGKTVLMTFFFARCSDVCPELQNNMRKVAEMLPPGRLGNDVVLLSVSFDRDFDDVQVLNEYAHYFQARPPEWRIALVNDGQELKQMLDQFEVIVLPDEFGGFEHNGALYVVNKEQKLVRIFDDRAVRSVAETIAAM